MIDATASVAPQPSSADVSNVSRSQDDGKSTANDTSFKDALNAAASGNQTKSTKTETQQTSEKSPTGKSDQKDKTVDPNAAAIVGAVQTAMAVQAQPDVTPAIQASAGESQVVQSIDTAGATATQQAQQVPAVEPALAQPLEQVTDATDSAPAQADTASAGVNQSQTADVQQSAAGTSASASVTTSAGVQPNVQVAGQIQAEQSMEQPKTDSRTEEKNTKPATTTAAHSGAAVANSETKIPVDTVSVQWKFDASSPTVQNVVSNAATATLVGQSTDSKSDSASAGQDSAADQDAANQQAANPIGLQFGTQLKEAAQVAPASQTQDLPTRVIDQVVREVKLSRIDGRSNVVVRLNPPDLGSMRLQITQDATGITTHIQTANSQVRGLLEAHMPQLMDSLAKAGVQVDAVQVSVGTSFSTFAGSPQQQNAQANADQARQQYTPASNGRASVMGTIADASYPTWGGSEQAGFSWLA